MQYSEMLWYLVDHRSASNHRYLLAEDVLALQPQLYYELGHSQYTSYHESSGVYHC